MRGVTPAPRFGAANAVTAVRAAIVLALAALAFRLPLLDGSTVAALWWATAATLLALALDGVDGWLARRLDQTSEFGARFDMETDAALGLVLCLLLWRSGETGAWILALGLPRYAFLAAAHVLPALDAPLYPSLRRKIVCVVQIGALAAMLAPVVAPPASTWIGIVAAALLAGSFARDVRRLLRGDRGTTPGTAERGAIPAAGRATDRAAGPAA